jgi:hypothetical protein
MGKDMKFEGAAETVRAALKANNARNMWLKAVRKGRKPEGRAPSPPTKEQLRILARHRRDLLLLSGRGASGWWAAVSKATGDPHERAKAMGMIWWDRCETEHWPPGEWRPYRDEGYDFDEDLYVDWERMEKILHAAGYSPFKARQMCGDNSERAALKECRLKTFRCTNCGWTATGCNYPPLRCRECRTHGTAKEVRP